MGYKILMACPAIFRFQWELDVCITNIRQFTDVEIVILFTEHNFTVPVHFRNQKNVSVHVYTDTRDDKDYIPSVQPWLWWQYLKEDPSREHQVYFYIDSDVIFREWPDCATWGYNSNEILGADCNSYIGLDYILGCSQGDKIAAQMAAISGVTMEQMAQAPGIGAQLVVSNLTADFWHRTYNDNNKLYHYLQGVDTNLQKWTVSMWAQLWGWVREGRRLEHSTELDFCTPTDPVERWDEVKILHNAGVTGGGDMFFKGEWADRSPLGQDFSGVRKDKATIRYVEALQKVVL